MLNVHAYNPGASIELSKPDARAGRRHWSICIQGSTLTTSTWTTGKSPKVATKTLADEQKAADEYRKAVRTKFRDGYVHVRDRGTAEPGAIVFAGFASGGGGGRVLDLSPDGLTAVTAGHTGAPKSVWVELIDTVTGERRTVFERSNPQQVFLLSAQFDHTGKALLITVEDQTIVLDIDSGNTRQLATYRGTGGAYFNSHVLRPSHDQSRRRFVLFDQGTTVRVVNERFDPILDVPVTSGKIECRAAAISPSGRLLAIYRVSHDHPQNYEAPDLQARRGTTSVVDIWDVDAGKLRESFASRAHLHRVGFDPRDELLITTWTYAQGPVVHALGSHQEVLRADNPANPASVAQLHDWDWSRDGTRFAAATGHHVVSGHSLLRASDMMTPIAVEEFSAVEHVIFSADGSLLATYEDGLCVLRKTA